MISVIAGLIIAVVAYSIALYKGRTGWHWFALSVTMFASIWVMSLLGLFVGNVRIAFVSEERLLAVFAGTITCTIMLVIFIAVPERPKKHRRRDEATRRSAS